MRTCSVESTIWFLLVYFHTESWVTLPQVFLQLYRFSFERSMCWSSPPVEITPAGHRSRVVNVCWTNVVILRSRFLAWSVGGGRYWNIVARLSRVYQFPMALQRAGCLLFSPVCVVSLFASVFFFLSQHLAVLGGMSCLNWHQEKRFDNQAVAFVVLIEN